MPGKGSVHDFRLYKETIGGAVDQFIGIDADLGYLGLGSCMGTAAYRGSPARTTS